MEIAHHSHIHFQFFPSNLIVSRSNADMREIEFFPELKFRSINYIAI